MFHKIIIVGAGMAGLGAAHQLEELHFTDYAVLEAQDQAGGRIRTISVNNKPLDIGAQWLHGKENKLYEIARKHDLISEDMSVEGEGKYIRNDGLILDDFLVKQVDFQMGKILQECEKFVALHDYPKNLQEFICDRFHEYLKESDDSDDVKRMKLQLLDWHIRFQVIDNACLDLTRLSAKFWGQYVCVDDVAHYNLKHGYQSLVKVLTDSIPEDKVILQTEVTLIEFGNKFHGQIKLMTSKQTYFCDHLILTSSLGCLKAFHNKITPGLPQSLTQSINAMGFHGIGKIYLIFPYKWWDVPGFQFIWNEAASGLTEEDSWLRAITGFDEVFQQPLALLGWIGGEALAPMEALSEEDVGDACLNLLRNFLHDYEIPPPEKVIRTRWLSDPWVKGGYCHITPECDATGCGIQKLGEPVFVDDVPRILLAGEAVHPSHYSTTHGAFESGQQQAAFLHNHISTSL